MSLEQQVLDIFKQQDYYWGSGGANRFPTLSELRAHIDRMKSAIEVGEQIISGRLIVIRTGLTRYNIFVMLKEEEQS